MERLVTMGEGYGYLFTGVIDQVNEIDDYQVEFKLKKPLVPSIHLVAYILNKDQVMANIQDGSMVNTEITERMAYYKRCRKGPYRKRNEKARTPLCCEVPDFWGGWDPDAPDAIKLIGTTETATVRTLMNNGELEISDQWQTEEALKALDQIPGVSIDAAFTGSILNIMLNTQKAPTDDIHFRKALAYVFDYDTVVDKLFPGSLKAQGPVPFNIPGFNAELPQYERNLEKAKEELAKSKYADQFDQYPIDLVWIAMLMKKKLPCRPGECGRNRHYGECDKDPWLSFVDQVSTKENTPHASVVFVSAHYNEAGSILSPVTIPVPPELGSKRNG